MLSSSSRQTMAFLLLGTPLSALPFAAHAAAPDAANPPSAESDQTVAGDAELVVTGKRDDRIAQVQSTPVSVTSLSGDKLIQQGITNVRELGNIVPNLYQSRTAVSYVNSTFFLRGVGEQDAQGEPSVPVYIDGIYIPKTIGSQSELLDIERVEVLRGPQGQAFGHSAAGGAILINTNVPGETPTFKAQLGYGNYNDVRAGLTASGPIGGDFYAGAAVSYHRRDGLNRNVTVNRDVNTVDYLAGRFKLRYAPSSDFDVLLTLSGVRDRSTARGVQDLLRGNRNSYNQIYPFNRYDQLAAILQITGRLSDHFQLKSLTTAYGFNQTTFFDNTGDFYGRGSQLVTYRTRTYQEDLQLVGKFDFVDFTTGLYYYREESFTNRRANTAANSTIVPANILYRPVYTLIQQDTDNIAAYGQAAFHPTSRLTLTAGLRYNWERHTQDNSLYNLVATAPFQSNPANFLAAIYANPQALVWGVNDLKRNWNTWSPKFSIDYKLTQDVLGYFTFSRGTKSAGYDYRVQTTSTVNGPLQSSTPFNPERVTNYEVGLKTQWLGGRVRANLSAFYLDFDDIQITATDPILTISRRFNAGKGSSRGVELEGSVIPVDGLQFDFNGSYLKARLDTFNGPVTFTDFAANPNNTTFPNGFRLYSSPRDGVALPNSPKWQGRLAVTWQVPLKTPGSWTVNGDVNYQSSAYSAITNNFSEKLPAQTYLNAQLTYTTEDKHWSAGFSVRNLTDRHYAQGQGYTADTTTGANRGLPVYRTTNYNDPRTVLFTLTYRR